MTNKKQQILDAALELFAQEGYAGTATSKIAKKAGVSEGLIFRHFENKSGLLHAIMEDVETRIAKLLGPIIFELDPKKVIQKVLELPFTIDKSEYDFWKLQFKLKWDNEYNNPHKMKPVMDALTKAFDQLGYAHSENEAQLVNLLLDGISTAILQGNLDAQENFRKFLIQKYDL